VIKGQCGVQAPLIKTDCPPANPPFGIHSSEERPHKNHQAHSDDVQQTRPTFADSVSSSDTSPKSVESNTPPSQPSSNSAAKTKPKTHPLYIQTVDLNQTQKSLLMLVSDGVGPPQEAKDLCEWATGKYAEDGWPVDKIAKEASNRTKGGDCKVLIAVMERNKQTDYFG
jgi:hypothetical protein